MHQDQPSRAQCFDSTLTLRRCTSPKAEHGVQVFTAFRSNVQSRAEKRGKAARAAVRFGRATQAAAMAGWREHGARRAAMRRAAHKALAALRNKLAAAALRSWRQTTAELADGRQQACTVHFQMISS